MTDPYVEIHNTPRVIENDAQWANALLDRLSNVSAEWQRAFDGSDPVAHIVATDARQDAHARARHVIDALAAAARLVVQNAHDAYMAQDDDIHVPGTAKHQEWQIVRQATRALALLRGADGDAAVAALDADTFDSQ